MATEWARIFGFKSPFIINAENVTKSYALAGRTITAIKDISLKVKPGTLTVIVGPSGSGKTTLLHILAGLIRPDSGGLLFHGLDISKAEDDVLRILREEFISIVYQEQSLVRYLTVEENVQLPWSVMGVGKRECQEASDHAISRLGLGGRKHHRAEEISGGERQLANMARALAKNPILVLADEPTANLDQTRIQLLMDVIREEMRGKNTTFVVATHDPLLASYADTFLELRDGSLQPHANQSIIELYIAPVRPMSPEIFSLLRDQILEALVGQTISSTEMVSALGTPYRCRIDEEGPNRQIGTEENVIRGTVTKDTQIHYDTPPASLGPQQTEQDSEAEASGIPDRVTKSLLRLRRPNIHYTVLKALLIPVSVAFLALSFAIWFRTGLWTAYSTSLTVVAGMFCLLVFLLAPTERTGMSRPRGVGKFAGAPGGIGWSVSKGRLCDFCGTAWAGEVCHTCGRKMCENCWPRVIREPTFCPDHLSCPVCGREKVGNQPYTATCTACLFCGSYVCPECYKDGMCLRCATKRQGGRRDGKTESGLSTLILEPVKDLANEICGQLGPPLLPLLQGKRVVFGEDVEALGMVFRVAATSPLGGGLVTEDSHLHVVNRNEEDSKLRGLREKSDFFVCYYPGCEYLIAMFCCVCLRPVCPNHSTRCKHCGCPTCEDHIQDGLCSRCSYKRPEVGFKQTLREIAGPLKVPVIAIVCFYVFARVMFYGEPLKQIHPSLPFIIMLAILILPIPYMLYSAWRRKNAPRQRLQTDDG